MAYNFKNVTVLIVECSQEMAMLLKTVLQMLTIPEENIDSALTSKDALGMFKESNHDLIITDWMENPDHGIKLTKKIREGGAGPNPYVPIIMTAGYSHLSTVLRARDSGISDYLVKPFSAKALASRISRVVEDKRHFVISENFVGPDRRFGQVKDYQGKERRQADEVFEVE